MKRSLSQESHFPHLAGLCAAPAALEAFRALAAQRGRAFEMLAVERGVFDAGREEIAALVRGGEHGG